MPTDLTQPPEHIPAGQLSRATTDRLRQAGKHLTWNQVAQLYREVEGKRADFVADALVLGVWLLAMKARTKHGQWEATLAKSAESADLSPRSLKVYMLVARRLLSRMEQGDDSQESIIGTRSLTADECTDLAAGNELAKLHTLRGKLREWAAGRSLDQLRKDLSQADKDIYTEDVESGTQGNVTTTSHDADADGADGAPAGPPDVTQLRFGFLDQLKQQFAEAQATEAKALEMLTDARSPDPRVQYLQPEDLDEVAEYHRSRADEYREQAAYWTDRAKRLREAKGDHGNEAMAALEKAATTAGIVGPPDVRLIAAIDADEPEPPADLDALIASASTAQLDAVLDHLQETYDTFSATQCAIDEAICSTLEARAASV